MQFKVGDKVRMLTFKEAQKKYGMVKNDLNSIAMPYNFAPDMMTKYLGKIVTIHCNDSPITIKEDNQRFIWDVDIFKPLVIHINLNKLYKKA